MRLLLILAFSRYGLACKYGKIFQILVSGGSSGKITWLKWAIYYYYYYYY